MKKVQIVVCLLLFISLATQAQKRLFIFGHSLLDHRPPLIATPSDETTVPHWLYLLGQEAGESIAAGGQYGFLPQHANVPPFSQWGYDIVPPVWDSDIEPFSAADITTVLLTAGNFMQWQGPDQDYPTDPGITPISATETVFDWVNAQESGVRYYIYENWPDMNPYLSSGFPPTAAEFANYNAYTLGAFHDWWIDYHDALLSSRPALDVRMIPVGPIISELLTMLIPGQIPITELYEDDAPHGRASTYFLASLVTYMAICERKAPLSYNIPSIVHPVIRNNYEAIVNFMWSRLQAFDTNSGDSRVFFSSSAFTLRIRVMLQGAYNGTDMNTDLQGNSLLPLTDPYGLNTTVTSIPANVVDWVQVEIRNASNNQDVLGCKACFLRNDGEIIELDGSLGVHFEGVQATGGYVVVRHRNHLGVMTNTVVSF